MQNFRLKTQEIKTSTSNTVPGEPALRAVTVWKSFHYASAGIWYVFLTQRNAKIHTAITALIILLAILLRIDAIHWALLAVMVGLVFSAEMFNTVVEAVVDLVCPEIHPLAKVAKDVAAGAVLLLAIISVVVGMFVLGPPLWHFIAVTVL